MTCREGDAVWNDPEGLIPSILEQMVEVNLTNDNAVGKVHVERIGNTYPLYALSYQAELEKIERGVERIRNLTLIGRCGRFWYNNMDDSIKEALTIGMGTKEKLQ